MTNSSSISEFERIKPTETYKKISQLKKLIEEEQIKTENLYSNRIATLDNMLKHAQDLMETFKRGE